MRHSGAEASAARWSWAVPIVALVAALVVAVVDPRPLQLLRNASFDQSQRWQPRTAAASAPVRIVDIDDETLRRLGQWPWPRTRVAELVDALQRRNAASIALDIVLAEPDRTSPRALLADFGALPAAAIRSIASLPDHDEVLAATLARSNAAIGFALTNDPAAVADGPDASATLPASKARFVTIGDSPLPFLPAFASSVRSLAVLQKSAAGQGAFSFIADSDGVVRKVPLVANLAGSLVPSLAAEALRLAEHASNVSVRTAGQGGGLIEVAIGRARIPTTADGAMWVHYSRPRAERYIPAWKLLAGLVPASEIAGRIVLVGTSAQGLLDLRFSPLGVIPGVEVHAQALEQVLANEALVRPGWAPAAELLVAAAGGCAVAAVAMLASAAVSVAGFVMLASLMWLGAWHAFTADRLLLDPVAATLVLFAVFLPTTLVRHVLSERRQRWVRQAFARYVSPNLVDHLIAHPDALALGGKRQRCSFVFADLAGFTALMETMDPAAAVTVLNAYLDPMIRIAFEHEGTLDRIVGDSVAIVFSTPVEQADHEARALRCALAMQRFARDFVDDWASRGVPFCETRIGVHSGEVTVGNFGGSTIFDYRALGDPVNTASRLEGANKQLGTSLCVSEATLAACPDQTVRPIGRLKLAGRAQPVMAYEPVDAAAADAEYAAAFALMQAGRIEAVAAFERLAAERPRDPLVQLHARRLAVGASTDLIELERK